ncbi:MAG: hypothetical protein ACJ74J_03060 [Blastocatellia bacterium]
MYTAESLTSLRSETRPKSLSDPSPRIGLYLLSANRTAYLISKILALGGCHVWVRFEIPLEELLRKSNQLADIEKEYCSWLFSETHVEILDGGDAPPAVDCLLYQVDYSRPRQPEALLAWMAKSGHITAWNTNYAEKDWWQLFSTDLRMAIKFTRFLLRTSRVVVACGRTRLRPTTVLSRGQRQGYFVHPKFLREPELYAEMFAESWSAESPRPVRLIFSGNPVPEERRQLIDRLKGFLSEQPDVQLIDHYEKIATRAALPSSDKALVLWMVRANSRDPQWHLRRDVIPPSQWPLVLRMCDFAFCPPGDERKTHRVVEALLQGVIPILDCPEEYDLGLRDGVNCLVVCNGQWDKGVQRALSMPAEEVIRLRRAIQELAQTELYPTGAARRWLCRLGFER